MKTLNPNAAEWTPMGFSGAAVLPSGTTQSSSSSSFAALSASTCAASSKAAAAVGQLTIQASTSMQIDSQAGVATPNGLAELATVCSADMTFEDLMFDNSSRRGSVSL